MTDDFTDEVIEKNTVKILNKNVEQLQIENDSKNLQQPPDGGPRAMCVMLSAFLCVGLIFGVLNTNSIFYGYIQKGLERNNVSAASTKASLVGSSAMGTTFLLSAISGVLTDKIGLRTTTFLGGFLCSSGMILASFFHHKSFELLMVSYCMYGLGAALTYTPSLAILGHYFKKRIGMVNGIVSSGSSLFTAAMPFILKKLIDMNDNDITIPLQFLGIISIFIMVCSLVYKPVILVNPSSESRPSKKSIIYGKNWKNRKYLIWIVSFPLALFGYFVPYIHIGKYIELYFPTDNQEMPIVCLGIASFFGRILFGKIGDSPRVNRIILQQVSVVMIGLSTMMVPLTDSYPFILYCFLSIGLFDGCFIAMIGPIAIEICGPDGATQAIGFLFAACSLPLTVGPAIAGWLYDSLQSYTLPFILSGVSPIFSAALMSLIHFIKDRNNTLEDDVSSDPLNKITWEPRIDDDSEKVKCSMLPAEEANDLRTNEE